MRLRLAGAAYVLTKVGLDIFLMQVGAVLELVKSGLPVHVAVLGPDVLLNVVSLAGRLVLH